MLLRYIVSNFKSIGHPVEFSMFPTEESTDERFLKTITTKAGEWKVLRRGGFFVSLGIPPKIRFDGQNGGNIQTNKIWQR